MPFAGVALAAGVVTVGAGLWLIAATGSPSGVQDVASNLNQAGATGEMNGGLKGLINLMLVSVPLIVPLLWLAWLYNDIVGKEEQVFAAWAQVESNYQRRSDLLPGLARTVGRYLEHERGTLIDVAEEEQVFAAWAQVESNYQRAQGSAAEPDAHGHPLPRA